MCIRDRLFPYWRFWNYKAMQNFFGFKFVSGQMPPKTHCPSMKRPLWYFLFPDALISTVKPGLPIGPVWFYIILSAQTSWQYLYQSFYWGGFIFLWGFVHSLNHSVAVRPSVSQNNNLFIGKFTTRKPWVDARPLQFFFEHCQKNPAHLCQFRVFSHPCFGRFIDDTSRLCSLHHCMHLLWALSILESFHIFNWAGSMIMIEVRREMERLIEEWQKACFSAPQSPIIERYSTLQRAATCSKSSFVMFIREGQENRNIEGNDDIIDLIKLDSLLVRYIHWRSFAEIGVAFKTRNRSKKR